MLIGYNNDVQYRGLTFHIQTEDRGSGNDQSVESQLFQGGQILDTRITPYAELVQNLSDDERDKKIRSIMQASHKGLFKKLKAGEYNHLVGLDPVESAAVEEVDEADFTPSQERVPDAARLVEQEGEAAFHSPNVGDHVDLAALKSKLAGLTSTSELSAVSDASAADEEAVDNLFDDFMGSKPGASKPGLKKPARAAATKSSENDEPLTLVLDTQTLSASATNKAVPAPGAKSASRAATTTLESHKAAPISPAIQAARAAAARLNPNRPAADAPLIDFEPTGQRAWTGCVPPAEDLSLLTLVEAYLHG